MFGEIAQKLRTAIFRGSGPNASIGVVPRPSLTAGTANFLREDATWSIPPSFDMMSSLVNTPVSVTGTASAVFGKLHVCTGTTTNYTVTLPNPSGNSGKFIGFRMAPGLTKLVTISQFDTSGHTDQIDGANTRILWANEAAILGCDGTNWYKVAGKSIPMVCVMYRTANVTVSDSVAKIIDLNGTTTDNTSQMADNSVNFRINILRPGNYVASATMAWAVVATVNSNINSYINKTGAAVAQGGFTVVTGNTVLNIGAISSCVAGDYYQLNTFQASNASASQTVVGGSSSTFLGVCEVPIW